MANPNTTTVYDPEGEAFEMSRANARDLVEHAGWSFQKPTVIVKEVPAASTTDETASDDAADTAADEQTAEDEDEDEIEEISEESVSASHADNTAEDQPHRHVEDFADYETREEMIEYLAKHFPDFKPHHKAGRDSLVEKAVELANG